VFLLVVVWVTDGGCRPIIRTRAHTMGTVPAVVSVAVAVPVPVVAAGGGGGCVEMGERVVSEMGPMVQRRWEL